MECQVEKLEHYRHILLFEFKRGTEAAEVARNICAVYGGHCHQREQGKKMSNNEPTCTVFAPQDGGWSA